MNRLIIDNLHVSVGNKEILKGVNLEIKQGEIHTIMGPNGSGKSTLSFTIAGHPNYTVTKGSVILEKDGEKTVLVSNDESLSPELRARAGIFLAAQLPTEVDGVTFSKFLRAAVEATAGQPMPIREWTKTLQNEMDFLKMDPSFASRYLNVGFSGGEKKRAEILQMRLLKPKFAILDETDSGLDVDALKIVTQGINQAQKDLDLGTLIITHHTNMLEYITPNFVHVFAGGKIVETGTDALAKELVQTGYSQYSNML